ncbi:isochorismate synthase, partial [Myxococcota bacterium]|nr:isochorismate synthase [Myxococcota bacterium]
VAAVVEALEGAAPSGPAWRAAADPVARARWDRAVAAALSAIACGSAEKVVLARAVELTSAPGSDVDGAAAAVWASLARDYPSCFSFALRGWAPRSVFLGASPERLVRSRGGEIEVAALAGSAPRGSDEGRDLLSAELLMGSVKARREHILVVRDIYSALQPLCARMEGAPTRVTPLPNILHLSTPIRGHLRPGLGALDAAAALHPTPAVGGTPRAAALRLIAEEETAARGWYAGAVGVLDLAGDGELAVALRSVLLRPGRAWAYAGAGIVAGSEASVEWEEIELKLRPVLGAMGVGVPGIEGDGSPDGSPDAGEGAQ